jgi:hypothetical protein
MTINWIPIRKNMGFWLVVIMILLSSLTDYFGILQIPAIILFSIILGIGISDGWWKKQ